MDWPAPPDTNVISNGRRPVRFDSTEGAVAAMRVDAHRVATAKQLVAAGHTMDAAELIDRLNLNTRTI